MYNVSTDFIDPITQEASLGGTKAPFTDKSSSSCKRNIYTAAKTAILMQLFKNKGYPLNKQAEDLIYKLVRNNITFGFKL
jgi:hypothetical protein